MTDYYTYHQKVTSRKRRRRAVIALLVVLAVLCMVAGWFTFHGKQGDAGQAAPVSAQSVPTVSSLAASSQAASAPAEPPAVASVGAGYVPQRLLPEVDTATWDTAAALPPTTDAGYYNTDFRMIGVPELGEVNRSYFDSVTFLGDSLTEGLAMYTTGLPNAHYTAYQSSGPNSIVNNVTMLNHATGARETPKEAIVATAPDYVYVMFGTNSLVNQGGEDGFIAYYERMIDELRALLNPGVIFYVQAIPGVQEDIVNKKPGLDNARIRTVNDMLANMALRKGCYFINTQEALTGLDGSQIDEYAAADGIHMNQHGYGAWVDYLSTHTVWDRRTIYKGISPYYIYGR